MKRMVMAVSLTALMIGLFSGCPVTPDITDEPNLAPTISSLTLSRSSVTNYGGDSVNITLRATDSDGTISQVYMLGSSLGLTNMFFKDDGNGADLQANDNNFTLTITSPNLDPGTYNLTFIAVDNDNASASNTNNLSIVGTLLPVILSVSVSSGVTNGRSYAIAIDTSDADGISTAYISASTIGDNPSNVMINTTGSIFTNKISPSMGLGSKNITVTVKDNLGASRYTNISVVQYNPITIFFINGYAYNSPKMWFWPQGGTGQTIHSSGNQNFNSWDFERFEVAVNSAATYRFKFNDNGTVWEDAIALETVQRGISQNASAVPLTNFVMSYNYNVFSSVSTLVTKLSNAPYNMTNRFDSDYIYPGAFPVSGGYVFSIFGPRATSANVAGTMNSWNASANPLKFDPNTGLWWAKITGVSINDNYKFSLNNSSLFGDPYGRAFNDGDHENSIIVSTNYLWSDSGWIKPQKAELIIYELNVKDFSRDDSSILVTHRGLYTGLIEKIAYLTNLGVNAIEIMPIQEWAGSWYSWGYNNSGYFAPENSLSTNKNNGAAYRDLKVMIDKLHQAGIAVILDVVYNHTANDNNYLWTIDNNTFFDPAGTPWGNKINMRNPLTQKFFSDNMKYWLDEFHVDGFRFDSTENIDSESIIEMVADLQNNGYSDRYFIFEEFSGSGNTAIQSYNTTESYSAISSWGTGYKYAVWDAVDYGNSSQLGSVTYYSDGSGWHQPADVINYFSSHDEGTLAGRKSATKQEVKVAATHLLTAMGVPMIWMGDEFMRLHYGNYPPTGDGIDEANNLVNWSLLSTHADLYNYYANLIKLRKNHAALHLNINSPDPSKFSWQTDWSAGLIGYKYYSVSGDNNFVILNNYNSSAKVYGVLFPNTGTWYVMCNGVTNTISTTGLSSFNAPGTATNITIPAKSSLIFMSQYVNP